MFSYLLGMRFLVLLSLFFSFSLYAHWDYRLGMRGRSYPVSAVTEADMGYNQLLWGERKKIFYGFLRPNLTIQEIGTYHMGSLALDVHPISFFKLRGGVSQERSHARRKDVSCESLDCQGKINHRFAEALLLLGAQDYFSQLRFRYNASMRKDGHKSFLEYETMLPMASREDHSTLFQGAFGKNLNKDWSALYVNLLASSEKAHASMTSHYALGMYSSSPWEIAGGVGAFRSSLLDWGFSALFWVTWTGKPSFALTKDSTK